MRRSLGYLQLPRCHVPGTVAKRRRQSGKFSCEQHLLYEKVTTVTFREREISEKHYRMNSKKTHNRSIRMAEHIREYNNYILESRRKNISL